MHLSQLKQSVPEPLLLVTDSVAALRWEICWLGDARGPSVAQRPPVMTPASFVDRALESPASAVDYPAVLSRTQAAALWRRTIAASGTGSRLVSTVAAGRAAADAWRLLHEWNVPWQSLKPGHESTDFVALLDWCKAFRRRLRREGWLDRAEIWGKLAATSDSGPLRTIAADAPLGLPPAVENTLVECAADAQLHVIHAASPAEPVRVRAADPRGELMSAAAWLADRLAGRRFGPYAVIMADAGRRRAEIESVLGDVCAAAGSEGGSGTIPLWFSRGTSLTEFATAGAAMNALELVLGRGRFEQLGGWLRSPFFGPDDAADRGRRASFEAALRPDLLSQWSLADAMRRGGLFGRLRDALPDCADRLRAALELAGSAGRSRMPTAWVELFERVLRTLGWRPTAAGTLQDVVGGWDRALREFAATSVVVGPLSADAALGDFRRIADGTTIRAPMPIAGVHVLERPEQLGPDYAGVWLTGFTDSAWPRPAKLNPLLPERLQRDWGLPGTTTMAAQRESRALIDRVLASAGEVVVSAPSTVDDGPTRPSRALGVTGPGRESDTGMMPGGYIGGRVGARALRTRSDDAPPLAATAIRGGMRLLELQSRCPVRAFIEFRLRARPIEKAWRGVSPRHRGTILHRALDLLYRELAGGGPADPSVLEDRIGEVARRAIAETIPWTDPPWDIVSRIERARAERGLAAMLATDGRRGPIDVVATEEDLSIAIANRTLRGRIDRIDRLGDGRELIIDYKTGTAPAAGDWFSDRLRAPQMPAYACARAGNVAGFVVAAVGDGHVDFRAAGDLPEDFPGRPRSSARTLRWPLQIERWRIQVEALLSEYAAGDVRASPSDTDLAGGEYAPATRIHSSRAWVDIDEDLPDV